MLRIVSRCPFAVRIASQAIADTSYFQKWNEEDHIRVMDQTHVAKAILSVTSPGTHLVSDDAAGRKLARDCNHFAADVKRRRPDRFGFFATLPLPDVEGSIAEIAYAFDNLEPDGVGILTNHDGVYLGDPRLDPVFEALNRRRATIFIHPTIPCMIHQGQPTNAIPLRSFPPGICEYFFEEARALFNLLTSRTPNRYPDLKFIIAHGGGAFPPIVERFSRFGTWIFGGKEEMTSAEIKQVLQRQFYFDTTGFMLPDQIHGVLRYVDHTRLLFGSDYPYMRADTVIRVAEELDRDLGLVIKDEKDREAIYIGNSAKLFSK